MTDAQNERTKGRNRRRGRRRQRGRETAGAENPPKQNLQAETAPEPARHPEPAPAPAAPVAEKPFERPADIAPPTVRSEEYCVHHMASFRESEPMQIRSNMTTLRHLAVDHFGEATLYCDCLHNGPHEWPPSMQRLHSAIELDQFLAASTSEE